jgi:hypothetical protein
MLRLIVSILCGLALAWSAPPLATVQDTLYKADGSRFNGFLLIEWHSFQAADSSEIATHNVTSQIVNGVLRVRLVPNASGTSYTVRYVSDGKIQFQETWFVPASSVALRLRDVRVATVGPYEPPPEQLDIPESNVIGLVADLAARPVKGAGYAPSRAVYADASGALEVVIGNLGDCVRVDGTAGPCGSGGGSTGPGFVDFETPAGLVNGTNTVFTLANPPSPASSLALYRNGLLEQAALDYTLSGNTITFAGGSIPQAGDTLAASYRLADAGSPQGPQVLCSSTGTSTNSTSLTQLGSCTAPAGLLKPGDRVEMRFDYSHEGAATGVAFEVRWGGTPLVSRSAGATETAISGQASAGIHASGAQCGAQSWGSGLAFTVGAGAALDSLGAPLTIGFLGRMAAVTSETLTLRNFSVIRYPAQANP